MLLYVIAVQLLKRILRETWIALNRGQCLWIWVICIWPSDLFTHSRHKNFSVLLVIRQLHFLSCPLYMNTEVVTFSSLGRIFTSNHGINRFRPLKFQIYVLIMPELLLSSENTLFLCFPEDKLTKFEKIFTWYRPIPAIHSAWNTDNFSDVLVLRVCICFWRNNFTHPVAKHV